MNMLKQFCFFLLLIPAISSYAQTEKEDPIDAAYRTCLAKDSSSGNICACAFVAYGKWNKEMDNAYSKLLRTLKKDKDKTALRQSQTAWMAYRDSEFKSYDNMFNIPGSKWCSLRQDGRIDIVRTRTLQLQHYELAFKKR